MNTAVMLAFASALFCGVVAVTVIWNERRSVVHLAFVAGMGLLALESIFSGLSWQAVAVSYNEAAVRQMLDWQRCKLCASSLLPGVWLFFALSLWPRKLSGIFEPWEVPVAGRVYPALGAGRPWTATT